MYSGFKFADTTPGLWFAVLSRPLAASVIALNTLNRTGAAHTPG